jgi:hypothetical protein
MIAKLPVTLPTVAAENVMVKVRLWLGASSTGVFSPEIEKPVPVTMA